MVQIITDSGCDLLPAEAQALGVTVVPLNVTFEDGSVVRDGVDITPDEYYSMLQTCSKLPKTSQPSPELFERLFREAAENGDEILAVMLSSTLSGTMQSARIAAEDAGCPVTFVDTLNVTMGQQLLVRLAVRLRAEGRTAAEIAAVLDEQKSRVRVLAIVDDLKYLHKGGRLPGAVAVVGGALGIKPVVTVLEGKVHLAGKARGLPGAYVALFKLIEQQGGIDPAYDLLLGYTDQKQRAEPLHRQLHINGHLHITHVTRIGAAIGTHVGTGAAGVAFFAKNV